MRVVLVYPNIAWLGFFCAGRVGDYEQDSRQKPLGLLYLAAGLKERGHEVSILDLRFLTSFEDFRQRLAILNPELVGVSVLTPSRDYAFRCAEIAKGMGKIVVGGGVYATAGAADMLESGHFDYVISGEADSSFPKLVDGLAAGERPKRGTIRGKIVKDLDSLPHPEVSLYDIEFYRSLPGWKGFRSPATGLICSRGCPAECIFCKPLAESMFGRRMRFRSVDGILEEVRIYVERYGIKTIHTYDDTFTCNRKLVIEFCERLARAGWDLDWTINARSNTFSEEVAEALRDARCRMASFGFESGSQRLLDWLKKGIRVEESVRAADLCHRYGIRILANVLAGVPGETDEDYELTYRFIKRIRPEILYFNTLIPFPGTVLHDLCEERGWLKPVSRYEEYFSHPCNETITVVDYERMRRWGEILGRGKLHVYTRPFRDRWERLRGRVAAVLNRTGFLNHPF